jgi:hypothetical protein
LLNNTEPINTYAGLHAQSLSQIIDGIPSSSIPPLYLAKVWFGVVGVWAASLTDVKKMV